jgi:O-antigen/teichoic acid export membrane protein
VLGRALALAGLVAAPMMIVFAVAPHVLLRVAFGSDLTAAAPALPILGGAMTLLAVAYLCVQYMLAVGRFGFLAPLAALALLEPVLLGLTGRHLVSFATIVLVVEAVAALALLALAVRTPRRAPAGAQPGGPSPVGEACDDS